MYFKVVLAYLRVSSMPVSKASRNRGASEEGRCQSVIPFVPCSCCRRLFKVVCIKQRPQRKVRGVSERSGGRSADFQGGWRECSGKNKGWIC